MAFKAYDFSKHFDYIAEALGYEVTYDNLSLELESRLFLRNEKDGNYAQIVYLTNNRFAVILCSVAAAVLFAWLCPVKEANDD